ncbi:putative transcription factor & chromatin remodeling ARID family [Helianthus anomalus]
MIYYEGLKDNPSESKETPRERAVVLSQFEEDVIENDIIIESCLDTVDLITLHGELANHQRFYNATFQEIIIWFIPCFLSIIKEGVVPPTLLDWREITLILLHRLVRVNSGFKEVIESDTWGEIAFKCGYEPDDAQMVKIAYIYYLELVEWYFALMKRKQEKNASNVAEKTNNGWVKDDSSDDDLVIVVEVTNNK